MRRHLEYLGTLVIAGALALWPLAAHAEVTGSGDRPWCRLSSAAVQQQRHALFAQAVDKHQQLARGLAQDFYEQALELCDDPDIRWNLALALKDLGQYLRAHQQLASALRWGEALGTKRLREVREQMQALETERLARIEAATDDVATEITLDGQPWFRGAGRQSTLVEPGEHYVAARKAGFFPVIRSVYVKAGQAARVALPMDADRILETRRWSAWKPWLIVSAGVVVTAVGAALERQAFARGDAAEKTLPGPCNTLKGCTPTKAPASFGRATTGHWAAVSAFAAGGTALVVGLSMAWMNQVHVRRTEARAPGPIEIAPILSTSTAGVSAQLQF